MENLLHFIRVVLFFCLITAVGLSVVAAESSSKNVKTIYKYKKFEKFDLDEMVIEGDTGSPGDLSISSRFQRKFKNRLPYRTNFNPEIRKSIQRIK